MTPPPDPRLRTWQGVTLGTLFWGYTGYYICRSVLAVGSSDMLRDPTSGVDDAGYGDLVAWGTYAYAAGKIINGIAADYLGGRALFLLGMGLSAVCVLAMGFAGGFAMLALLWSCNRYVQSSGWGGLVQIAGRWYHPRSLATVMGVLTLSYLFGDALARLYLGAFARAGSGWRDLFLIAAITLGVLTFLAYVLLKSRPRDLGLPEPPPPPANLHGSDRGEGRIPLRQLLGPLLCSPRFWLVCGINAGLTSIREVFNNWTPRYLDKGLEFDPKVTGLLSFVFPLAGAFAALGAGWLVDRLGGRYGRLMVPLLAGMTIILGLLAGLDLRGQPVLALTLLGACAFFLMGPYTFCSGVLAVNLGGQRAAAASAGIIDASGYIFSALIAGTFAGRIVKHYGFGPLLDVLAVTGLATCAVAIAYWVIEERGRRTVE